MTTTTVPPAPARPGLTPAQLDGLACAQCGASFTDGSRRAAIPAPDIAPQAFVCADVCGWPDDTVLLLALDLLADAPLCATLAMLEAARALTEAEDAHRRLDAVVASLELVSDMLRATLARVDAGSVR
jgi:hypothetical protein